jgi:excisionase family DNA binding protein
VVQLAGRCTTGELHLPHAAIVARARSLAQRSSFGELRGTQAANLYVVDVSRISAYRDRMTTLLNVQRAARRLGVSPHTIRRWTASGFLPCTRTVGGHRRIKEEDLDEVAQLVGDGNHLAARVARERELETLVNTSVALSSQLDLTELLAEIAKHMTGLLNCHFCAISEYDEETRTMRVLADFDHSGRRWPDWNPYSVNEFPLTKRVMTEQETAIVNINDPRADAAEVAIMRRNGDKALLLVPLVYQGRSIGLLEVLDHVRERRFTRQEMRLARALAGQAAVGLHNARVFGQLPRRAPPARGPRARRRRPARGLRRHHARRGAAGGGRHRLSRLRRHLQRRHLRRPQRRRQRRRVRRRFHQRRAPR